MKNERPFALCGNLFRALRPLALLAIAGFPMSPSGLLAGQPPAKAVVEEKEKAWEAALSTGWDSLYMFRGLNCLRDGQGYGAGLYWTDLQLTWNMTKSDFLTLEVWQAFATSGPSYRETDAIISYTRILPGDVSLTLDYEFQYGDSDGNYYANELGLSVARDFEIGIVTLTPSISYAFDLGPDSETGPGMVKAGSGFLLFRLDGNLPVYRDIIALAPWTAFGVNFEYNTKDTSDGESVPFNGANNFELGISVPIKINQYVSVSGYGAYSYAFANLTSTQPNTFWGGVSVAVSY